MTDRLPPHDTEAEQSVIACILIDSQTCMDTCIEKLPMGPEAFYDLRCRGIYTVALEMHSERMTVDVVTLQARIKSNIGDYGGLDFIMSLPDFVPSTANLPAYLEIVCDKYLARQALKVCTEVSAKVYSSDLPVSDLLDEFERGVMAIRNQRSQSSVADIKEVTCDAINRIEQIYSSRGKICGLSTGFPDLDRISDGLHDGEMTVIAGYPGAGKTALAMNIAGHCSVSLKLPVGIFSLEMSALSLVMRFMFAHARINSRDVRDQRMTQGDFRRLTMAAGRISTAPIYIDDSSDLSVYELRARARRMARQHALKLIIVDYLQLLSAIGGSRKVESRQQEVTDISRGIKGMARELGVPVIALSQLNDDGKLRESRAIGQDADQIWILKRDDDNEAQGDAVAVKLEIVKARNGPTGFVNLTFLRQFTRFESAAKISREDVP